MTYAYVTKDNNVVISLDRIYDEGCADGLLSQHRHLFGPDYHPHFGTHYNPGPQDERDNPKGTHDYVDTIDLKTDVVVPVAIFKNEEGSCLYLDDGNYTYLNRYVSGKLLRLGVPHPEKPEYLLVGKTERVGTYNRRARFPFYVTRTRVTLKNNKRIRDVRQVSGTGRMDPEDGLNDEDYLCLEFDTPDVSTWLAKQLTLQVTL